MPGDTIGMNHPDPAQGYRLLAARDHAFRLYRSHRLRRAALIIAIVLAVYGLLGFFAAPPIMRNQLQTRLTVLLDRPVSLAEVHFDPFTLRLQLDHLHIADRDGHASFIDVDRMVVNASWTSLLRMAPVLDELSLQHPQLHLTRTAPQQFNFSDLLGKFAGQSVKPGTSPTRFALSNISVHDGHIVFDDAVTHASHRVDQLELGIPFIANLPHDTNVFVQPLLTMTVDGSRLRVAGQTKPFADSRESVVSFSLNHLDLPRYLGYVPAPLPVAIPSGQLSGELELHFVQAKTGPQVRLGGQLDLDDFVLANHDGSPILALGHASAVLDDVEPLLSRYRLGTVQLNHLVLQYTRKPDGHGNFDALTGAGGTATGPTAAAPTAGVATDLRIATLTLRNSRLDYIDASGSQSAALTLQSIDGTLQHLSVLAAPPARIDLTARLNGGSIGLNGKLDMAASDYTGKLEVKNVALAPLLPLAPPVLHAELSGGTLDADAQLRASWGKQFNLHLEPARFAVNDLALRNGEAADTVPLACKSLQVHLTRFDLASSYAHVAAVALSGLKMNVRRLRNGRFDLAQLVSPAPSTQQRNSGAHQNGRTDVPAWHWQLDQLTVDDGDLILTDRRADRPSPVDLHADHYRIEDLSSDMHKPLQVALTGTFGRGRYDVGGKVIPQPLAVRLKIRTRALDIAPLQTLISVPLNVRIGSALLSLYGQLGYRDRGSAEARIDYRGAATLGRVRVQDKLTGDDFLRWRSLAATGVILHLGDTAPRAEIGGLALSDFYARVIVNSSGRLNLQDVVANGTGAAPVSVTRAENSPAPAAPTDASPIPPPAGPPTAIRIGQITLARGELNYTDNFIKPNYSANITDLVGSIGAFGSEQGPPAALVVQGKLDENSPLDINGSINPLTPMAFLDIKAKADAVQLTQLSPYSGKYAGYPITGGVLSVDVHYLLDQRKLTADNHIFIEQLTFGQRIDAPGVSHLPVKLAVALLRNAQGQIDVHIPVSGSLDNPKFSMGGLIWHAFVNLIARAATSPFRLLASIGGGKHQDLGYVEFAPGSAVLNQAAQARLTELVKLLRQKPSLKLDITGRMDPAVDEKGLRAVMVDDLVRKEKADHDGGKVDPSVLKLTPDEYRHYLTRAYRHAKFAKPKNLIGFTKSQPPEVMRQLLETHMPVDADALRRLADRRAAAVKQWLQGKIDPKRLAMHPPRLDAKGISDQGKTTRVDFGLH